MPSRKQNKRQSKAAQKIVITGVNSFIGSNLSRRLANDPRYQLVVIDIKRPEFLEKGVKFYKIDITEPMIDGVLAEVLKKEAADTVVHLAFLSSPIKNTTLSHELEVIGTLNIIHASSAIKLRKFILRSTTMVYGANATNPNFITEEHPLRAEQGMAYLRDKMEVEHIVKRFGEKNPHTVVTVLRPCATLGPTIKNFLTSYLASPIILTVLGFDPLYQFVHEEDVIDMFRVAVEGDYRGAFNIVGRGVLPFSTVLKLSGKIGIPVPYPIAYSMVSMMWSANLLSVPPAFLNFLRYSWLADGSKARKMMNYEARYTTKDTLESFMGTQRLRELRLVE
ncbi:MAG: NAD-dependent epimerase/dehydratase family protein [Deltaproteobacteria bacterium]|nr:NAD-dependent epimerase/dehydratase family protein [Deltaproteobacteria bacterium]